MMREKRNCKKYSKMPILNVYNKNLVQFNEFWFEIQL
jgi:hypothetical protein